MEFKISPDFFIYRLFKDSSKNRIDAYYIITYLDTSGKVYTSKTDRILFHVFFDDCKISKIVFPEENSNSFIKSTKKYLKVFPHIYTMEKTIFNLKNTIDHLIFKKTLRCEISSEIKGIKGNSPSNFPLMVRLFNKDFSISFSYFKNNGKIGPANGTIKEIGKFDCFSVQHEEETRVFPEDLPSFLKLKMFFK